MIKQNKLPPPWHRWRNKWKEMTTTKKIMEKKMMGSQRKRTTMTLAMRITCPNNLASPRQQLLVYPKRGGTT